MRTPNATNPGIAVADGPKIDYRRWSMNVMHSDVMHSVDRAQAAEWADWFRALGDPTRVMILHVLSVEERAMTVGEITDRVDVGQSTVSHHLAKLADVGFVLVDRVGTSSWWRVNAECIESFPTAAEMIMGRIPRTFRRAVEGAT